MESNLQNIIVEMDEFQEQNAINAGPFSKTVLALKLDSVTLYAQKYILFPSNKKFEDEDYECFKTICGKLMQLNHPCSMKISYISLPDIKLESNPSIYTIFTPNYSLQNLIEDDSKEYIDETQKIIILYGVSQYINYLHKIGAHGRLKASNILLDSNFYPLVSDPFFHELSLKIPYSNLSKTIDYVVSLSNETLSKGIVNLQTDIYSFGILALQILTRQINVFSNISDINEIEQNILKGITLTIPDHIKGEIRTLIEKCLSIDPLQRPDASYLVITLQKELKNEQVYDKTKVDSFQQYLNIQNKEENELKKELQDGIKNDNQVEENDNQVEENDNQVEENDNQVEENDNQVEEKDHQIEEKDQFEKEVISFLNENNYFFANDDIKRLITLYRYLEDGFNVSLTGPNRASKTLSSEVVCRLSGRKLTYFAFNENTALRNILKENSPFITAFENGHTLLLDGINQVNSRWFHFLKKILNDGFITAPGINHKILKHKDFRLITKQDSTEITKINHMHEFIDFPEYTKNDLIEIGQILAKRYKCDLTTKFIEDLVEFTIKWKEFEKVVNCINLPSINRIIATIRAISENENLNEIIMIIYGSMHTEENRIKLQKLLISFQSFKFLNLYQHDYPKDIPEEYRKPWFLFTLQSILFFFNNKVNVILTSEKFVDISKFAKWVAQYYSKVLKLEKVQIAMIDDRIKVLDNQLTSENNANVHLLCICDTNKLKEMPEDFIGKFGAVYLEDQEQIKKEQLINEEELKKEQLRRKELKEKYISACMSIIQLIKDSNSNKTQENNKKYLCCIDCSSFANTEMYSKLNDPREYLYANVVLRLLSEYSPENIDIYLWDSSIHDSDSIDIDLLVHAHKELCSELIAEICEHSNIRDHLIIITGGHVNVESIDESDRLIKLNGIKFSQVTTYSIGNGDLSVGAPYSRNYPSKNCSYPKISLTKKDVDALDGISNINSYNEFDSKYLNIYNAIFAKTLGTKGDKELYDKLTSISPRIRITCIGIKQKNEFDNKMKKLQNMALGALRNVFSYKEIDHKIEYPSNQVVFNKYEAAEFFQMAANKGDINSMISYANMLKYGDEISTDKKEAVRYYKMATDNENVTAMGNYAEMLYFGEGTAINKPEAIRYLKIATENGYMIDNHFVNPFSCFNDMANSHGSYGNLWCIDCSGSVSFDLYHNEIKLLLSKYRQENDDFYLWNHEILRTSSFGMDIFVTTHLAFGGTCSELIADICEQSSIRDHLIIITDGGVSTQSIDESDWRMYMNGIKFNHVTTYVIGRGGDLSVGAPYSRNCPSITYKVEEVGVEIPVTTLTKEDLDALAGISDINTYNSFNLKYPNLQSAIQAKTLGTQGDKDIQDKLSSLSPRIKKSGINEEEKKDFNQKINPLVNMAVGAIRKQFSVENIETTVQKPTEEVAISKQEAANYFKMGADKGDVDLMVRYANVVKEGGDGLSSNKQEATHYYKMAADNGDVTAMFNYADMLQRGDGVPVNHKEAARYFKMAADNGNPTASLVYAFLLKHGEGVSANASEAADYFKKAADDGDSKMKIFYAYMLKKGDGIPANEQEAKRYFEMAGIVAK